MAKFRATKPAFYGGQRIRIGDEVHAPEGFSAKWAEPVGAEKKAPEKKAPAKKKAVRKKAKKA